MRLFIDKIPDEGMELDYEEPARSFDYLTEEGESLSIGGAVRVGLKVRKGPGRILVTGHMEGSASMRCSRCLEEMSVDISHDFSYECVPEAAMGQESEELSRDSADLWYYKDAEIDVSSLVQEQAALAIPLRPLCREDCKGLCQTCGANLNAGDCGCRGKAEDVRFAALKGLEPL